MQGIDNYIERINEALNDETEGFELATAKDTIKGIFGELLKANEDHDASVAKELDEVKAHSRLMDETLHAINKKLKNDVKPVDQVKSYNDLIKGVM